MPGINKVILVGNVGKDPEIRHIETGSVAKFPLATTERYKNKAGERTEKTEWHNISIWSPLSEIVEKYVHKGSRLYIEGRLQTRSYEDSAGNKRYFTEIVGREMLMLDSRSDSDTPYSSAQAPTEATPEEPATADEADDLPF